MKLLCAWPFVPWEDRSKLNRKCYVTKRYPVGFAFPKYKGLRYIKNANFKFVEIFLNFHWNYFTFAAIMVYVIFYSLNTRWCTFFAPYEKSSGFSLKLGRSCARVCNDLYITKWCQNNNAHNNDWGHSYFHIHLSVSNFQDIRSVWGHAVDKFIQL